MPCLQYSTNSLSSVSDCLFCLETWLAKSSIFEPNFPGFHKEAPHNPRTLFPAVCADPILPIDPTVVKGLDRTTFTVNCQFLHAVPTVHRCARNGATVGNTASVARTVWEPGSVTVAASGRVECSALVWGSGHSLGCDQNLGYCNRSGSLCNWLGRGNR
jgi:hypothetical protein